MRGIWAAADQARADGFAVEGMLHEAAKGWVNRAVDAWLADGMEPEGDDYDQLRGAMGLVSGLGLGDALRFPGHGKTVAEEAAALESGLGEALGLLMDLAERMAAAGHRHAARLAGETAAAVAEALKLL